MGVVMIRAPERHHVGGVGSGLLPALLIGATIALSALTGGAAARMMHVAAGSETLLLAAALGGWLLFQLCVVKYDVMVFVCFALFGLVLIEPAPTDVLSMLLLVTGLLIGRLSLKHVDPASGLTLALWGFLLANVASTLFTFNLNASLRYLMLTTYLLAFTVFVKLYVQSVRAMRTVLMGYLVSAALSMGLVVLGYLGIGTNLFLEFDTRAAALFKDANVFGPFLVFPTIFLIDEILHPQMIERWAWAKWAGVMGLGFGVYLSGSRGAWGNLTIAFVIYAGLTYLARPAAAVHPRRANPFTLPTITAACVALLITILLRIPMRISNALTDLAQGIWIYRARTQLYDPSRFARQLEGIYAGLDHPLGVGPGIWDNAHSLYVRTFAEHGMLGLIVLLLALAILLARLLPIALEGRGRRYGLSARVILACLIGALANSFVIDSIHWRHLWLMVGLAWVLISPPADDGGEQPEAGRARARR
jgi:hypothetical protein